MTRVGQLFRGGTRQLRRTPVVLALLVVMPAYVIYVFTLVAPEGPAVVHVSGMAVRTTLPEAFPAFTTPMTAALLAGIMGLFLMESAAADSRLVTAGYRPHEVVLARLGILTGVAILATTVSVGVMLTAFRPNQLAWFLVGTILAALSYGMVGVLAGLVLDRLPGVYLILFGTMLDLFIFQNPLATEAPAAARFLPGHYPLQLVMAAGFTDTIDLATLGWAVGYVGVLTLAAIAAFYRTMDATS